jgi:hypothetical protein
MIPFLTTLLIAPAAGAQLLLNQATADQLSSLDGVEAHEAAQIVQLRSERSRLSSVEELRVLNLDPRHWVCCGTTCRWISGW